MKLNLVLAALLLGLGSQVQAAQLYGSAGYSFGGDSTEPVTLVDQNDDYHNESLKYGDGLSLAFGGVFKPVPKLELQATLGYKVNMIAATNANINFTRMPIDLLAFFAVDHFRVGGGLTHEMSPDLEGDDFIASRSFNDADGTVIEAGYRWTHVSLNLRFTQIDYTGGRYDPYYDKKTVNGDSIGLLVGFRW